MTDVRCPSCGKGARVTYPGARDEQRASEILRRDLALRCPRNRGANALPCPMSVSHEPEPEKAL